MNDLIHWHNNTIGQRAAEALNRNNFSAKYFTDRQTAVEYILRLIPRKATVGMGGSSTVMELELWKLLEERGHELFNHNKEGLTAEERNKQRYKQLTCDVFLTGSNAITLTGKIVNRDAFGNRVAAMIFGPKKVIIVAGINKVVRDFKEADERIKMHAAPLNVKRYEMNNPCLTTGECIDCNSPARACNITTILSRRPPLTEIYVIILGESLGF
ncbi:lactate utilization protein [Pectinatus haikarae]|uniref:L-lactate utilization protein LutB n=1 Tax=Pectinatus haikarae TaxID=349096 RepID=A0ABT9YAU5_9FIRM|nr:lactate utilization protein [Pectinatus haikarae]MDQ0204763.1 L-lactate utilization protein LutB [Pectinatus haikarae]